MALLSYGNSDVGCVRAHNEDRIFFDDSLGLYVVCDGIGGRRRGDLAAEIAADTIREYIEASVDSTEVTWPYGYAIQQTFAGNRLLTAVKLANRQVWRRGEESLQFLGMGATVTAVLVEGANAAVANVGDSRVYLWRAGILKQLSVDDTIPMGQRSVLTRAAGPEQNVEVHLLELPLSAGDVLLLCSDGLHGYLSEERIAELLGTGEPIAARADSLIAATRSAGAPDNVSAVLVQYQPGRSL